MISYVYLIRNMYVNIRYEYALTVQRIVASREHALSVWEKAQVNMEEHRLCHFCSGACCRLPSIDGR